MTQKQPPMSQFPRARWVAPSQKNASVNPVSLTRGIRYIELSPDRGRLYHRHGRQFPRRRPPRQRSSGRSRRASLRSLLSFCLGLRLQRSAGAPPLRSIGLVAHRLAAAVIVIAEVLLTGSGNGRKVFQSFRYSPFAPAALLRRRQSS